LAEPEEQLEPSSEAAASTPATDDEPKRGKTVHGAAANAGHRVLAPDDAEVEAYLEVALDAPAPDRSPTDPPVAATVPEPGVVAVLDFGSQLSQLIARRVRELNVYSELLPHDTPITELERRGVRAIILSGGPNSVYDDGAPRADASIWSGRLPVLGICYGAQLMALELGGDVLPADRREYGPATIQVTRDEGLFQGIDREQPVWMSHGDSITRLPRPIPRRMRGWPRRPGACTASSSTPRSSTRRAGVTCFATS
jgi:GMP synthase (glutamine-hydrolysing) A subunit